MCYRLKAGLTLVRQACLKCLVLCLALSAACSGVHEDSSVDDGSVRVFAAASLNNALTEIGELFQAETGRKLVTSYAGSSVLARQIQKGAPVDLFISANQAWMDMLEKQALILTPTRFNLLGNNLALISQPPAPALSLDSAEALATALEGSYLAMALVDAVPAGIYGKQALEALGAWEAVKGQVLQADNARAALALVAKGEARLGLVYSSDAKAEPKVEIAARIPGSLHDPIVYPAALVVEGRHAAATMLLDYLQSDAATAVFAKHGFSKP